NGQFLWATPFPYDTKNFIISSIDVKTGITHLNTDLLFREPGQNHVLCYWNTRSYWPLAYHPGKNALYVPYVDNCLDMTSAAPAGTPPPAPPYEVTPSVCQGPPTAAAAGAAPALGGGAGGRGGVTAAAGAAIRETRTAIRREGSDPQKFSGIAKVDMSTGEI